MAPTPPVKSTSPVAGPALLPMGHHEGKPPIRLTRPVYIIGSRSSCRIHLVSSSVSKAHAILVRSNGRTYIRDLASRSKVYINGEEVREADLAGGDLIKIGTFTFQYVAGPTENKPQTNVRQPLPAKFDVSGAELPIPVDERVLVIGRRSRCDIHLLEDTVSTSHAVVFEMDGNRYVRDLGSRTGTYVNGVSTHQHMLSPLDTVRIGDNELRYAVSEPGVATVVEEPEEAIATSDLPIADLAAGDLTPLEPEIGEIEAIQPERLEPEIAAPEAAEPVVDELAVADLAAAIPVEEPQAIAPAEAPAPEAAEAAVEEFAVADLMAALPVEETEAITPSSEPAPEAELEPTAAEPAQEEAPESESIPLEIDSSEPSLEAVEAAVRAEAGPIEIESTEFQAIPVQEDVAEPIEPEILPVAEALPELDSIPAEPEPVAEVAPELENIPMEPVETVEAIEPAGRPLELHAEISEQAEAPAIEEVPAGLELAHEHLEAADESAAEVVEESALDLPAPAPVAAEAPAPEPTLTLPVDDEPQKAIEPEVVLELDHLAVADLAQATEHSGSPELSLDATPVEASETVASIESGSHEELPLQSVIPEEAELPAAPDAHAEELSLDSSAAAEVPAPEPTAAEEERSELDLVAPPPQELAAEPILPPEPVEVIDKTEPTAESALESAADQLALDALATPDVPLTPVADELSDTQFDRSLREFTGTELGELVEPPIDTATEIKPEEPVIAAEAEAVDQLEIEASERPIEQQVEEPSAEAPGVEPVLEIEQPIEEVPALEAQAPLADLELSEVDSAEPSIDDIADAALSEPASELPLPQTPAPEPQPVAETPAAPARKPPGMRPRVPWGANQDNFLGGAPLPLAQPAASTKPAPASERAVRDLIQEIDHVAAKAEAAAAAPAPAPPADTEPPIVPLIPPRPRRPAASPPRRRQKLIVTEETSTPERNLVNTGFDGLANSPLRDMDVFSQPVPRAGELPPVGGNGEPLTTGADGSNAAPASRAAGASLAEVDAETTIAPARRPRVTPDLGDEEPVHAGERRPQVSYAAELTEAETAQIRRKYHRRVYLLLVLMLALLGGSWWVIQNHFGASTSVEGSLRYQNLSALTKLERTEKQQQILAILAQDGTRRSARAKLLEQPEIGPGFLVDQETYVRVIERAAFSDSRPDVMVVKVASREPDQDAARVRKVLEAQYELNKGLVDDARRAQRDLQSTLEASQRGQAELERLTSDIAKLRVAGENSPTGQQLNELQSQVQQLEKAWNDAVARVKSAEAELERLKSAPAASEPGAQGVASADDPTLRAMLSKLDELQGKVTASKSAMTEQATSARKDLDAALDAFQQQVAQAQGVLNANPALTAFIQDAQRLQETTRQLTSELIRRQEAQFALLTELKERLNDRMEKRRIEVWQGDQQLREYTEKLAVVEREYNAAVGGGLAKEAEDKKAEMNLLRSMIRARQELLPGDSFYADAIGELQKVIDSTRKDIESDRRRTEEMLTSRQESFVSSQTIRNLPDEQRQIAAQLQQKFKEINDARQQYNSAVDAGASDGDAQVKSEIATLQAAIDSRRKELTDQNLKGMQAQQERERQAAIQPKQEELDKLKEAETQAETAYFNKHRELREAQDRVAAMAGNSEKLNVLLSRKDIVDRELRANNDQLENKKRAVATSVEPVAPNENDITLRPGNDQRALYLSITAGSIVLVFALLIALTMHAAAVEAPVPSIQAADLRPDPVDPEDPSPNEAARVEKADDDDEEHEPAAI